MIVYGKEKGVNWRVFEKESCERYFGEIFEVDPTTPNAVLNKVKETGSEYVAWRNNTEYNSNKKMQIILNQENKMPDIKYINSAKGWKSCYAKEECFKIWKENNILYPAYFEFNNRGDFKRQLSFDYPYLIRVNNECSGYCSYLIHNEKELNQAFPRLLRDKENVSRRKLTETKLICQQYLDTTKHGYNRSYRIIVAGDRVITGYARMSLPPDWIAIAGKFTPDMKDVFIEFNKDCETYIKENESEIVRSVHTLNLNFQGVDVIPVGDDNYFLEVQPGFACGYADPKLGYKPPFYNPSYPELVKFLLDEKELLKKEIPMYYNKWLNKEVLFDEAFSSLKKHLGGFRG